MLDFDWSKTGPAPGLPATNYTARWTGTITVPASAGDVVLAAVADDGARVWIDGQLVIDAWGPHAETTSEAAAKLTAGQPHQLRIEYLQLEYSAVMKLQWRPVKAGSAPRISWLPPGNWMDAWSGGMMSGPVMVTNDVPLEQIPIFIRAGAILPLAPEMQYTGQLPWNPVTLDLYPCVGGTHAAMLYEDDTLTTAYQRGKFRNILISASADDANRTVHVNIGAAAGTYHGALKKRTWVLRIHPPADWSKILAPAGVTVNGKKINEPIHRLNRNVTAMPFGDQTGAPDANVFELTLPAASISKSQSVEITFSPLH